MTGMDSGGRTPATTAPARRPHHVLTAIASWTIATVLAILIGAPVLLLSAQLYDWAAGTGLGLGPGWALLAPASVDLATVVCIAMSVVASFRRERPGFFAVLIWVFAAFSAAIQYRHGLAERDAGRALDAWWAMPAISILGPVLLHAVMGRFRRWYRQDADEILTGSAGFGARWLVAPWSTMLAWAASRREGIRTAPAAIAYVAERKAVKRLDPTEAVSFAIAALGVVDPYAARAWLAQRRYPMHQVTQSAIDRATAGRPVAPQTVTGTILAISPTDNRPTTEPTTDNGPGTDPYAERLAACRTKRDAIRLAFAVLGEYDQAKAFAWLTERGVTVQRSEVNAIADAARKQSQP